VVDEMLKMHNIPFLRIHGSVPSAKRAKILVDFERSTSIRVLLITFGTGGVGYV
jgi:SWI/SNF-related matrix-associated actin-dependent regulator of chromatin subfamily A3